MRFLMLNANRVGVGTYHRAMHFGRELARHGHDVTMMTVSNTSRFRAEVRRDSDRFTIIECPNWGDELLPWHASGILDIWLRTKEIWTGNYDVVYAFEYQPNISVPVFATRLFRRFTLISDWCDWHAGASYHFGGYKLAHAIDRVFEEFIRHRADFLTTINKMLHQRALSIGIERERVAIVGEGVDPEYIVPMDKTVARRRLGVPEDVPIVGSIRDLYPGAYVLCDALRASKTAGLELLLIGSKTDPIRDYAEKIGVADRVRLVGRVSDEDLPAYIACADVLALPLENKLVNQGRWPHKLGDMLAAQRPVVVSTAGEFTDLVAVRNCGLVVDFNGDAFATAIDDIFARPSAFVEMAKRGRALIEEELNWDVIGAHLEEVVQRAASLRA